jgi:hypothetical protein
METIPNAEDFFLSKYFSENIPNDHKKNWLECNSLAKEAIRIMLEFTKSHKNNALQSVLEEVPLTDSNLRYNDLEEAILNCYPDKNIK